VLQSRLVSGDRSLQHLGEVADICSAGWAEMRKIRNTVIDHRAVAFIRRSARQRTAGIEETPKFPHNGRPQALRPIDTEGLRFARPVGIVIRQPLEEQRLRAFDGFWFQHV
jgi:hypothetical protein